MVNNTLVIEEKKLNTREKIKVLEESKVVSDKIIWLLELSENDSLLSILKKYSFIKQDDSGIKADFSNIKFPDTSYWNKLLSAFLKEFFWKNYYIKGLYENISALNNIYEKAIKNTDIINLWSEFIEVSKEWYEYYFEALISANKDSAKYSFPPRINYDKDKFIANLYKRWVLYWFDAEEIDAWIYHSAKWNRENKPFIVAKQKDPEDWIDSILEIISPKVEQDLRSRDILTKWVDTISKIDVYSYANATFDVESHERLFRKTKPTKGRPGKNVIGWTIKNKEWVDNIKLEEILWEGLEIQEINEETIVLPTRSWTLQKDVHTKKYIVTDWYVVKQVDIKTWDIKIEWEDKTFLVEWNVVEWRTITWNCKKIEIKWNLFGNIEASWETEIIISWNMMWKSNLKHTWTWKISIWGIISNLSVIDAKKADVKIWELQNWNIFSNSIELDTFFNWNLIAKNIIIENLKIAEKAKVILLGERVDIRNLDSKWIFRSVLMLNTLDEQINMPKEDIQKTIDIKYRQFIDILKKKFPSIEILTLEIDFLRETFDAISNVVNKNIDSYNTYLQIYASPEWAFKDKEKITKMISGKLSKLSQAQQKLPYRSKMEILKKPILALKHNIESPFSDLKALYEEIINLQWLLVRDNSGKSGDYHISIEEYTKNSSIEIYNYFYKSKKWDFYDLSNEVIDSILKLKKGVDWVTFIRENTSLVGCPFKYSPTKK